MVGPLALLWLILGYFQQGEELKQSTRALQLQAEELRNSVAQQQLLVAVSCEQMAAQLNTLESEQERCRIANRSFLELSKRMSVGNGQVLTQSFDLVKLGADAFQLEMSVTPALEGLSPLMQSTLRRDASLGFSVALDYSASGQFILLAKCVDAIGNVVHRSS